MEDKYSAKNCYLGINGKKYGPVSEEQIITLYQQKKITENTKFIRVGMSEWIPLSQSGIIASSKADDVPPLPQGDKPVKKSKLGVIAAVLGVAVVVVFAVMTSVIVGINNDTKIPLDNDISQNMSIESPASRPVNTPAETEAPPIKGAAEAYIKEQQARLRETVGKLIDVMARNFNYIGAEISANDLIPLLEKAQTSYTLSDAKNDGKTATVSATIKSTDMAAVVEAMEVMVEQLQSAVAESPDDTSAIINLLNEFVDGAPTTENTVDINLILQDGNWIVSEDSKFDIIILFSEKQANFNQFALLLTTLMEGVSNNKNVESGQTPAQQEQQKFTYAVFSDEQFGIEFLYPEDYLIERMHDSLSMYSMHPSDNESINISYSCMSYPKQGTIEESIADQTAMSNHFGQSIDVLEKIEAENGFQVKYHIQSETTNTGVIEYCNTVDLYGYDITLIFSYPYEEDALYSEMAETVINSIGF